MGASLTLFCGWLLWGTHLGDAWVNASYDYLFRFNTRVPTNNIALVLMDNAAFDQFHQTRGQPWNRALHAKLLNKLADDGCAMVVMDTFFQISREAETDQALAAAMQRQRHMVLMAEQSEVMHPSLVGAQPILPQEQFLRAAGNHWGVAWLNPDLDHIVRHHWPFPSPGIYPSLSWTAAQLAGARLDKTPTERWLRYYGEKPPWTSLSYGYALSEPTNYFRDRIVFIGSYPKTSLPGDETDEFQTPYTLWTDEAAGGVEIMVTTFLNLLNGEWLERPAWWIEATIFTLVGIGAGGWFCRMKLWQAFACGFAGAATISLAAITGSAIANYWFPWLIIAGGQIPCALAWTVMVKTHQTIRETKRIAEEKPADLKIIPDTPGYELFHPPFGEGAYGKVWLAKNAAGQWRAVKAVYLANFDSADPYDREYRGVTKYKPVSEWHPGLLRVEFVSEKHPAYFYYVMELGDALEQGWEKNPALYKPRDLINERKKFKNNRLPVDHCIQIGLALAESLEFLHQRGLTHRDIKPRNILFVAGQPKLADLGLIAEIRPPDEEHTYVGTPGYMPPPPEIPGTPQADIYALGMVLYVLSTGRSAGLFPELATSLVASETPKDFFRLNNVILKACQPDPAKRFASAAELGKALREAQKTVS